jgi:hypothetical protein
MGINMTNSWGQVTDNTEQLAEMSKEMSPGITSESPFYPVTTVNATNTMLVKGYDSVNHTIFVINMNNSQFQFSTDYGATWSMDKELPGNITYLNFKKVVAFKNKYYAIGMDATDANKYKIYSCDIPAWGSACSWTLVHTLSDNATLLCGFSSDSQYIYCGEYCGTTPITGGPSAWRSADGTTWLAFFGPDPDIRHIHDIKPDPFNPGHVWMTTGDASKPIMKSVDYGDNWELIATNSVWQCVQISFTEDYVWLAGDADRRATAFVVNKITSEVMSASPNSHHNMAVPGEYFAATTTFEPGEIATGISVTSSAVTLTGAALGDYVAVAAPYDLQGCIAFGNVTAANTLEITVANLTGGAITLASGTWKVRILRGAALGDRFSANCFFGIVDPNTGIYYCISNDMYIGNRTGLFYIPGVGRRVELIDPLNTAYTGTYNFEMYVINGYVYFGQYRHKVITLDNS